MLIYLINNDTILSLNITATFIWEQIVYFINDNVYFDEEILSNNLIDHFKIDKAKNDVNRIKNDVERFIKELVFLGLLIDNYDNLQKND